ncbi:MAG: ABC transporter substrate-binding protein [Pseudomonadota bacterium]|nr:ABC transporter substrate-binding protein [Pseudomonadota bacterium]
MRAFALSLALLAGCADPPGETPPGTLTVLQEQQAAWVRNFNPLLSTGGARWPTASGIYEPLLLYNRATGETVPWLATAWTWTEPARRLRFDVRAGVTWSDGAAFEADDVAYTFDLLKRFPALDGAGAWTYLESVRALDAHTVEFVFTHPYSPGLSLVGGQAIVPKHAWQGIADPVSFTNPNPVGTGPFTEIRRFDAQLWELGRNPRYWQEGLPKVDALRFPAVGSNDQALLALVRGEVDWAGSFVPAIERTYVARDPAHFHYWFPAVGDTVFLYPQTTRAPLDDARVRQALSLAIDRKRLVRVAMHDYVPPSHPTALSDGYRAWRRDDLAPDGGWVRHDPAAAGALLDAAGWPLGEDGRRANAAGEALVMPILCPAGWSDWVRAAQIIARDLDALGVDARVEGLDFASWFDRVSRGDFALALGWSVSGPTPHAFYRSLLGSSTVKPVGTPAATNWHRYGSPAADDLLAAFEATVDPAEQHRLSDALQAAFVAEAPAIPLFPTAAWGEFNTQRFDGFPDRETPYATLSPNAVPDVLLVLTRLRPRNDGLAERGAAR